MKKFFVFVITVAMMAICGSAFANSVNINIKPATIKLGVAGSLIEAGKDEIRRHNITTINHLNPSHINKYIRVQGDITRLKNNANGRLVGHIVDYSCDDYLDFVCSTGNSEINNLVRYAFQQRYNIILGGYVRNINGMYVLMVDRAKVK